MSTDSVTVSRPPRHALVIGAANVDLCGHADSALNLQESNPGKLDISVGGVGRNIADNLARLGADSRLLSIVGDDHWGQQIMALTVLAGVNIDLCITQHNARSSSYLSLHNPDGEMKLALNDMSIIDKLDKSALSRCEESIKASDVLVLDANLSESALALCFSYGHQTVFVDPVSSAKAVKLIPFLASVNTLKPNRLEAQLLSDVVISSKSDISKAANVLHDKGVENVFVSSGSLGGYWSVQYGEQADFFPVCTINDSTIANVTGAGDALMAALSYCALHGWDWRTTGRFAMAASAVAVSTDSTINSQINKSLVLQVMEQTIC